MASQNKHESEAGLALDPGFVDRMGIQALVGPAFIMKLDAFDASISELPRHVQEQRRSSFYAEAALNFAQSQKAQPIQAPAGALAEGDLVYSVEELAKQKRLGAGNLFENKLVIRAKAPKVLLRYASSHMANDATRNSLRNGTAALAVLGRVVENHPEQMVVEPLLMGTPLDRLEPAAPEKQAGGVAIELGEVHLGELKEFNQLNEQALPDDFAKMKALGEAKAFQKALAKQMKTTPAKGWNGEGYDLYLATVNLHGKKLSAAFLVKVPEKFGPLGLRPSEQDLDLLYRFTRMDADLYVLQHGHDIGAKLQEALRYFTRQATGQKRFMLVDGRETLRFLRAYGHVEAPATASH